MILSVCNVNRLLLCICLYCSSMAVSSLEKELQEKLKEKNITRVYFNKGLWKHNLYIFTLLLTVEQSWDIVIFFLFTSCHTSFLDQIADVEQYQYCSLALLGYCFCARIGRVTDQVIFWCCVRLLLICWCLFGHVADDKISWSGLWADVKVNILQRSALDISRFSMCWIATRRSDVLIRSC